MDDAIGFGSEDRMRAGIEKRVSACVPPPNTEVGAFHLIA